MHWNQVYKKVDVLIIGGGAAGCFSALNLAQNENLNILVTDKAFIKRSGCLAAGLNAINAYVGEGETVDSFTDYVKKDAEEVIREDLVYTLAEQLKDVTTQLESIGLPFLKDDQGNYVSRGKRSIKINGENFKPILYRAVWKKKNIRLLEQVSIVDYIEEDGEVLGAIGVSWIEQKIYIIHAAHTICATGGASGIYKPNNPKQSKHKMWYSPFNTGAGYAMGIRCGAEMTSFEMRFIALRIKDTIAPTGTIAQGIGAVQVNAKGETYVEKYGKPSTPMRLYATVMENKKGNGPCYLKTVGIGKIAEEQLYKAYLNMSPAQTLKWLERDTGPDAEQVMIEGTEPYIVGGHGASGYWIDTNRQTTLRRLYAIGDVAGGSPKKYVSGSFAEGKIAATHILQHPRNLKEANEKIVETLVQQAIKYTEEDKKPQAKAVDVDTLEEEMQDVMDVYAGGISASYTYNSKDLSYAKTQLIDLSKRVEELRTNDLRTLQRIYELRDRLLVAQVVIAHLEARKETRWRMYQENEEYPEKDDVHWKCYVNSICKEGKILTFTRPLVKRGEHYEH